MKNKLMSRIIAVSVALMTAVSAMAVSASAVTTLEQVSVSNGVPNVTGSVYESLDTSGAVAVKQYHANDDFKGVPGYTKKALTDIYPAGTKIWVQNGTGLIAASNPNASGWTECKVASSGSGTTANTSDSNYVGSDLPSKVDRTSIHYATKKNVAYQGKVGNQTLWFPNLESLYASGATTVLNTKTLSSMETYAWMSDFNTQVYFNMSTGEYTIAKDTNCVGIKGSSSSYDRSTTSSAYRPDSTYRVNGKWYPTYALAYNAAGGDTTKMEPQTSYTYIPARYYSIIDGEWYSSWNDAMTHANQNANNIVDMGVYVDGSEWYGYLGSPYYDPDYYYYYGYPYYGYPYGYYGYYGYYDATAAYWADRYGYTNGTTSSKKDTTTATVGNVKGWTSIAKNLSKSASGSSVNVKMNKETSIPADVFSAIKGKDITVKFTLSNGVVFSVNGKDVSSATSISPTTSYNTKMVPTKLVKSASKKNKAVSTAQFTISGGSFGAKADVTIKLSSKRSGKTAKLYRYNSSKNSLSLVDSSRIQSNGKCTFNDLTQGGNYLVVIC